MKSLSPKSDFFAIKNKLEKEGNTEQEGFTFSLLKKIKKRKKTAIRVKMEEITQFSGVVDTQSNLPKEGENRAFRSVELEFYVVITVISF